MHPDFPALPRFCPVVDEPGYGHPAVTPEAGFPALVGVEAFLRALCRGDFSPGNRLPRLWKCREHNHFSKYGVKRAFAD